jgi:hypothetical protein
MDFILDWIAIFILVAGIQITFKGLFLSTEQIIERFKGTPNKKLITYAVFWVVGLLIVYRQFFLQANDADTWAANVLIFLLLYESINDLFGAFYRDQRIKLFQYTAALSKLFISLELLFFCYLLWLVIKPIINIFF